MDQYLGLCRVGPECIQGSSFITSRKITEVSLASVIAAHAALNTCFGSGGATLVTYDNTVVPRLAYPGAEHLELWDNLLPAYADGTLTGLTW